MDDLEPKTLDQLSLESKEKKYVTIEDGSKISGYTKDYLERLCRLYKIDYRTIKNSPEKFVLELESLLRETHTLLISREGIFFVDKNELAPEIPKPAPQPAPLPPPAPVLHPPPKVESSVPAYTSPMVPEMVIPSFIPPTPKQAPHKKVEEVAPPPLPKGVEATLPPPPAFIPHKPITQAPQPTAPLAVNEELKNEKAIPLDDWDAQLFGEVVAPEVQPRKFEAPQPALYETPSPYRPIRTAVGTREHEDKSALFPVIGEVQAKKGDVPIHVKSPPPTPSPSTVVLQPLARGPIAVAPEEATTEPVKVVVEQVREPAPIIPPPPQQNEVPPVFSQNSIISPPPLAPPAPKPSYVSHAAMRTPAVGRIVLPVVEPEHHLAKQETHALTKSVVFNVIFALTLISSSLLYLSNAFPEQLKGLLTGNPSVYVASPLPAVSSGGDN